MLLLWLKIGKKNPQKKKRKKKLNGDINNKEKKIFPSLQIIMETLLAIGLCPKNLHSEDCMDNKNVESCILAMIEDVRMNRTEDWLEMGLLPNAARKAEKKYQEALKTFPCLSRNDVFKAFVQEIYNDHVVSRQHLAL